MAGAIDIVLAMPESPEVLLVRSLQVDNSVPFTSSGTANIDLIYAAFANQVDLVTYNNEFEIMGHAEGEWIHAKLSGSSIFPAIDSTLSGYYLTHSIFYATDWGRSPVNDTATIERLLVLMASETNKDLFAEYALCLLFVGSAISDEIKLQLNDIVYVGDTHLTYVMAMVESYGII